MSVSIGGGGGGGNNKKKKTRVLSVFRKHSGPSREESNVLHVRAKITLFLFNTGARVP